MAQAPTIPGYELLHPLGGGLLTVVHAARELASDVPCVVKLLRPEWQEDSTAIKLLQREARAGLATRHPHLVRVREAHVTRLPYFLVMERLPGESLRARLRQAYRLPLGEALRIARQTAEALSALHRAGFLHGDVKPDNVRLTDPGTAVLLDLGLAHRPGENEAFLRQGFVLGTANYLAPELCDPQPREELRSDLFSLGVTLFEMLSGKLPYPPGSLRQTFRRHQCDPPADVRETAGHVPAPLADLLGRLLARRPEGRPRAAAVVHELVKWEIATLRRRSA